MKIPPDGTRTVTLTRKSSNLPPNALVLLGVYCRKFPLRGLCLSSVFYIRRESAADSSGFVKLLGKLSFVLTQYWMTVVTGSSLFDKTMKSKPFATRYQL
jgi:hypothetical protein